MPSNVENGSGNYTFPFQICEIREEMLETMCDTVKEVIDRNSVLVGPKKYFLPGIYKDYYRDIYNFKARPDDILLIGIPRTGTTLHSEMIWQIENGLDFETVKDNILTHRFPLIDLCLSMGDLSLFGMATNHTDVNDDLKQIATRYTSLTIDNLAKIKGQRFIRAHLPISLLSPSFFETSCKVIYCARNPKDLVVSYYHVSHFLRPKEWGLVPFPTFWKAFKENWIMYTPYFEHVKEAWTRRLHPNFLFVFYEDTAKDMRQGIANMAKFLGKDLSQSQLEDLAEYLGVEKFKKNTSVNCQHLCDLGITSKSNDFIREGKNGGWRKYFVGELEADADEWIRENLKGTDLVFPDC